MRKVRERKPRKPRKITMKTILKRLEKREKGHLQKTKEERGHLTPSTDDCGHSGPLLPIGAHFNSRERGKSSATGTKVPQPQIPEVAVVPAKSESKKLGEREKEERRLSVDAIEEFLFAGKVMQINALHHKRLHEQGVQYIESCLIPESIFFYR